MILLAPIFLLLALPLAASLWLWRMRSWPQLGLRIATLTAIVLMLAGLAVRRSSESATVIVVADRSLSMPADADAVQKDSIAILKDSMASGDRLGVVSFGRNVAVEAPPTQGAFGGFTHEIGRDASNLTEAIETALALIPLGDPGRLVVLSDGQWTGRDPASAATLAAERGIAIDYRAQLRASTNDFAIARIDAPSSVQPVESFLITAWVLAPGAEEVGFELRRDGGILSAGKRQLEPGLNRFTFRDRAAEPGTQAYALTIQPKNDAILENNSARFLVGVDGARPLLVVTSTPKSGLPALLKAGGLNVVAAAPEAVAWTLEDLSRFSGVLLENVPAGKIGHVGMETLAAWVQQTGSGLMIAGGRASYGPGGYYKSPLDPLLPVSMELRQEHRKLSIAIVVALDRSGSMTMPVGGGRIKMDLANLGAAQVVDLLSPNDEFGCIAVDTDAHIIKDLAPLTDKAAVRDRILRINSEGGGIYVYEALDASLRMIRKAKAGARHIILFADADDAVEPKQYLKLLSQCRAEGITVSAIGLGRETGKDAALLKDVAAKGNGRVFFTDRPEELPRLFAQDTFVVARNSFLDAPTPFKTTAGLSLLTSKLFNPANLGGYNLCYLRPNANLGAVTLDEYSAPVIASWQSGAGRVLCYTGEMDGKYTGPLAQWKDVGEFYSSLARWTIGRPAALPDGSALVQERKKGIVSIALNLDPDRSQDSLRKLPEVAVLRRSGEQKPTVEKHVLRWTGADSLSADVPLQGDETMLATVHLPDRGVVSLPPVCLLYSPEFEPAAARSTPSSSEAARRWGLAALEDLGQRTGGRERIDLAKLWSELPRPARFLPLSPWLLAAGCVTILLEVFERLTGLGARRRRAALPQTATTIALEPAPAPIKLEPPPTTSVDTATIPAPPSDLLEALRKVRDRKRS